MTMWREREWKIIVYHDIDGGELYNLADDPNELNNLWDQAGLESVQKRLTKRCFDAAVFTMDPLPERVVGF